MSDDKLRQQIINIESGTYVYDFQIADEFKKIANDNEITEQQSALLESEFIAFRFMSRNSKGKRFHPMVKYTNGTVFPDEKTEISPKRLQYWLERAKQTTNPIMKARYLDLNYEYNIEIKKEEIAKELIDSYITASLVTVEGNETDRIDSITRAFELAVENKASNPNLLGVAKKALLDLMNTFAKENIRWSLEILELVVAHNALLTVQELVASKRVAKKGVEHYRNEKGSQMVLESYMKVEQELTQLATPDEFDKDEATRANAQLYLDSAEQDKASPFLIQYHLLQAEKILREGNLNKEANEVHARVEAVSKDPDFTKTFKTATAEFKIPQTQIDSLRNSFEKAPDKGVLLAAAPVFFPSYTLSKKEALADKTTYVSDMFSSVTLNEDNMPIGKEEGDDKNRKIMRYYDSSVKVSSAMVHQIILNAVEDGSFTQADIQVHLDKIKGLNPETYESVQRGFERLFKAEYYEALAILLPQLEDLLGDVMVGLGVPRYQQDEHDTVEYKMLGKILGALEKKLGSDAYRFLKYQLIDPIRENLRNINGHGKLKITTPSLNKKAMIVLQAYMVILARIEKKGEDTEQ